VPAQRTLAADLLDMLQLGQGDVLLRVSDESGKISEFPAHKAILMARSPVFCAMLKHAMKEKEQGVIEIEDTSPSTVAALLKFLYGDQLPVVHAHSNKSAAVASGSKTDGKSADNATALDSHDKAALGSADGFELDARSGRAVRHRRRSPSARSRRARPAALRCFRQRSGPDR